MQLRSFTLGHVLVAGLAGLVLAASSSPAVAKGGSAGGTGSNYYLNDSTSGQANIVMAYGEPRDDLYIADMNGDGRDGLLLRRGNTFYLRNSLTSGVAEKTFSYGNLEDKVFVGDWNGDGVDTLAVQRGNTFYIADKPESSTADRVIQYGNVGDHVLVGDWNGDGVDTLAVRRGNAYYISNSMRTGVADAVVYYGNHDDTVVVGNWNGRSTTLGVRRGNTYYLKNSLSGGVADVTFAYGNVDDAVLVGDWNGDGTDSLGVRRPSTVVANYAQQLVDGVNAERRSRGLDPLTPSSCAQAAAQRWAELLASSGQFYHQDLSAVLQGCAGSTGAAENLARTSGSAAEMVALWMGSPGHRSNILDPTMTKIGSAAVRASNGQWTGVHVFLK